MSSPDTIGELALLVLGEQAAAFLEHVPAAAAADDIRGLHQTRVATRRLRAALRLFGDVLPPEAAGLHDELAWIAAELGPARDLDVQVQRLREAGAELGVSDALAPYGAWLEGQRQRARRELDSALKSIRFEKLAQHLADIQGWPSIDPHADARFDTDAPRRLRRVFRKLRKRADRIGADAPPAELHRVRIRAKRLRYAAEFFAPAYGKPAQRLVQTAVALQDLLGGLQDGVVSNQLIVQAFQTSAGTWPAETSLALGQVLQYNAQRCARVRKRWTAAYDDVKDKGWKRLASRVAMS